MLIYEITEWTVKLNSSSLFTAVDSTSSGECEQAAEVVLKYLYLLPDGVSGRYGKILSMWNVS